MTIKEVSQKYGVSPETLRYYEKIGLLDNVDRDVSGYRNYKESDLSWIDFLLCMRNVGIKISVLKEYVDLYNSGDKTIHQREQMLLEQKKILLNKIKEMNSLVAKIDKKINFCNELDPF